MIIDRGSATINIDHRVIVVLPFGRLLLTIGFDTPDLILSS